MKIFAPCMQCQADHGHPSFEPIFVDYYDDALAFVTCSAGHKTAHLVQSSKFEILLESGATALLEGFTLEASVSFSIALERFYEFALRVVCEARGFSSELYAKTFSAMARQSERQLGAFILLYALEFDEPYKPSDKIINFRNSIIHKGEIPTLEKANEFATEVYKIIISIFRKLKENMQIICARLQYKVFERSKLRCLVVCWSPQILAPYSSTVREPILSLILRKPSMLSIRRGR